MKYSRVFTTMNPTWLVLREEPGDSSCCAVVEVKPTPTGATQRVVLLVAAVPGRQWA